MSRMVSPIAKVARCAAALKLLISPLAGEMSGGTEGGGRELGFANASSRQHP